MLREGVTYVVKSELPQQPWLDKPVLQDLGMHSKLWFECKFLEQTKLARSSSQFFKHVARLADQRQAVSKELSGRWLGNGYRLVR